MQLRQLSCSGRGGSVFFFFQAEDGIRDDLVTGVQTCALPISLWNQAEREQRGEYRIAAQFAAREIIGKATRGAVSIRGDARQTLQQRSPAHAKIGRASCRERV